MRPLAIATMVLLAGCAHATKPEPVVILGNTTEPAVCEHADLKAARADAAKWKAYAETLETALKIPHKGGRP